MTAFLAPKGVVDRIVPKSELSLRGGGESSTGEKGRDDDEEESSSAHEREVVRVCVVASTGAL